MDLKKTGPLELVQERTGNPTDNAPGPQSRVFGDIARDGRTCSSHALFAGGATATRD